MIRRALFSFFVVASVAACSGSDKSGATNPPYDAASDAPPPLGDPQCIALSLGLSRPVAGVSGGVQSIFTLSSHSVLQSPVATGASSLITQFTGGKLELDWLGTVDDGSDVPVTGGVLTIPADDPAPAGTFCVVSGTVWHKASTGGKIDFVVTSGECASSDAGTSSDASSSIVMKGCLLYPGPPDAGPDTSDADETSDASDGGG